MFTDEDGQAPTVIRVEELPCYKETIDSHKEKRPQLMAIMKSKLCQHGRHLLDLAAAFKKKDAEYKEYLAGDTSNQLLHPPANRCYDNC